MKKFSDLIGIKEQLQKTIELVSDLFVTPYNKKKKVEQNVKKLEERK